METQPVPRPPELPGPQGHAEEAPTSVSGTATPSSVTSSVITISTAPVVKALGRDGGVGGGAEPIEEKGGGGGGGLILPPSGAGAASVGEPAPPTPGPTKRESLRNLALPLVRRYSQNMKDASSPWAVGLSSTRARAEKERRQWEVGVSKFNQKPSAGVDYLVNAGLLQRTAESVAGFLRQHTGELSKRRVGEYVGSPDPFAQGVLAALLRDYDFEGLALDEAMRLLINDIRLPGESQQIDRILQRFAARYYACNCSPQPPQPQPQPQSQSQSQSPPPPPQQQQAPCSIQTRPTSVQQPLPPAHAPPQPQPQPQPFATEDAVYVLSFSLILLNTDLHNRSLRQQDKMRLEDFVRNNRGINNGQDLPREYLAALYQSVKRRELRMREGDMYECVFLPFVVPRLSGWLAKESTGAVARWKSHWFVLSHGVLYYFNSPQDASPRCLILLESATAIKGPSPTGTDILLYSHGPGGLIKSVKIRRSDKSMVQGTRTRYLLRAASREERDDWLVALQQETPALLRQRAGSASASAPGAAATTTAAATTISSAATTTTTSTASTIRSPRSAGGLGFGLGLGQSPLAGGADAAARARAAGPAYRCLAEGWMRRRSDVSRSWQRRYFMLLVSSSSSSGSGSTSGGALPGRRGGKAPGPRVELCYFTTQEMGRRMLELGLMTAQGVVPMQEGTVVHLKATGGAGLPYRPPEPGAAVWEVEAGSSKAQRVREVVSPEEEKAAADGDGGEGAVVGPETWLQALREHCPGVSIRMG